MRSMDSCRFRGCGCKHLANLHQVDPQRLTDVAGREALLSGEASHFDLQRRVLRGPVLLRQQVVSQWSADCFASHVPRSVVYSVRVENLGLRKGLKVAP